MRFIEAMNDGRIAPPHAKNLAGARDMMVKYATLFALSVGPELSRSEAEVIATQGMSTWSVEYPRACASRGGNVGAALDAPAKHERALASCSGANGHSTPNAVPAPATAAGGARASPSGAGTSVTRAGNARAACKRAVTGEAHGAPNVSRTRSRAEEHKWTPIDFVKLQAVVMGADIGTTKFGANTIDLNTAVCAKQELFTCCVTPLCSFCLP